MNDPDIKLDLDMEGAARNMIISPFHKDKIVSSVSEAVGYSILAVSLMSENYQRLC